MDAGIQDVSTSISIEFKIEYLNELIEMSVDDESDTHVEARDRRYSCLKIAKYIHISTGCDNKKNQK